MKVCVITTSYPRSENDEASIFVRRMVAGFSEVGLSGLVVVPSDLGEQVRWWEGSFQIETLPYTLISKPKLAFGAGIMPNLRRSPWLIYQVPGLLFALAHRAYQRRAEYDLIHANWIGSAIPAWMVSKLSGKLYLITLRGEDVKLVTNPLFRLLLWPVLSSAARITVVAESFRKQLLDIGFSPSKIVTVFNGSDLPTPAADEVSQFENEAKFSDELKTLVFVGTILPRKQIELLIDLMKMPQMNEFRLMLCGRLKDEPYVAKTKRAIESAGLGDRVLLTGALAPRRIALLLRNVWGYITASAFEGRPNSVLEALGLGVPVFASNIPAHAEVVKDGVNGYLFETDALPTLAERLCRLRSTPDQYSKMSSAAKQSVSHLTWRSCAEGYRKVFEEVVESRRGKLSLPGN